MKDEDSFDLELEKLNEGKLPDSHVFNLGKPGEILQNCGFPAEHRIELAASRLRMKANQGNHPFDILDIKGLTKALQEPVAVFEYGDKNKSQNVIVNLEKDGKNFLVGVFFNQIRDGFEVSSIRGLFNRDNMDWMHWIQQGKMIYGNKEKIQVLAEQQRTNLADVYSKEARTSSDSYYLDSVDNILQSFGDVKDIYTKDFPKYEEQKERFEIFKKFRNAYKKTETINVLDVVKEADEFYDALKSNNKEVIARYTDTVENPELADEETIPQVVEKSINEEKTKMPDQLIYAAAEVGQVIEQRTPEAQSIVNPTRVDRLSTISVPLNKEYNEDFPLSTEKNMSETQKSINEQKTKLQILEQEDKEQLEAMVMTARETIKESLAQDAVPLVEIEFSKANYDRLFPRAIVQTPIETVKLGENQFEKLDAKDRKRFLLATFQTLATPDLVIDEEREGSHSHNYIKSFIFDEKTKAVQDVVVNINGENISITAHPRDINNVVNKIKMPDQLVYAAARVGQVIEQRVQNELGIVNPTRADRLSTISVPLNKEYNMENALSIISEFQTFKGQKTESEFQKKIDEMKKTIEARNMQEVETVTSEKKAPAKKQTTRTKADIIKQAAKDFSEAIKDGLAPFFDTKDDFQKIIMRPSAIVNAANGRPFSGESQLLAQIYHKQHEMEGEIVTSIAGAKAAGTIVLNTKENLQKNFALTDTSLLAEKNTVVRTRYFMPESCKEPDKIYAHTLQQQRPDKIRSYRDLIRHFENIPNGQKEITDIRIRIAHEHLKEIQSRFAIKEERTLSVDEIEERKNFLRNYFERLPADYRDTERSAFEDTFGIQLNSEKNLEINLQRKFKDIDFDELKKNTKKSIELENRKLSNFIEKNTMDNKKLASLFSNEYKSLAEEEKLTARNLKIEALGIKEPETFLGKYLAACNTNAEFITDKETVEEVKKNLVKKLEENFKLEKYDILKEIGQQAQSISNETTKQISFEKAHSNNKSLGKTLSPDKEISLIGMGK
ncbi:MAG: hypothetical protein UIB61_08700 [Treponema sp.]|nr:hypothetical protein [Treponema sp.]